MSHRNLPLRRAVATTLALSCALATTNSWAQTPAESSATFGEIIVTAQKREQNLQDVPVVVTAVSAQLLHDTGVKDIKDLTVLTPGLLVTSSSSEASTTARIRGIGTVGDNPGLESSVGVVIDGVYRPRNGVGFGDLGEMERVEVLKGPQGTLFGKNTSAGVINVVSKKPTFDPNAVVEVTAGNFGTFDVSASLNGPLVGDTVAGRFFYAQRQRDGLLGVKSAGGFRPDSDGDRDFFTLRGQLLFNLSDAISLRIIADRTERDEQCCAAVQMVYSKAAHNPGASPREIIDAVAPDEGVIPVADPYLRLAYANRPYGQLTKDGGLSGELNWDLGSSALTSLTAVRDWRSVRGQDTDYTTADIWYRNADGNVFSQFRQISEELRLAGKAGSVNWLGGVFYAKEKLNTSDQLLYGSAYEPYASRTLSGGAATTRLTEWTGLAAGTVFRPGTGLKDSYQQSAESFAVFTDNSIEITEGLELTLGARYTSETKDLESHYWNPGGTGSDACRRLLQNLGTDFVVGSGSLPAGATALIPNVPVGTPEPTFSTVAGLRAGIRGLGCGTWADPAFDNLNTSESLDESKVTGTAKLAYRFADPIMAYLSYARGYKAGGFNLDRERSTVGVADLDKSFPAELVNSYELGAKMTFGENAVFFNVAAFHQTYDNFQLNTFLGTSFVVTAVKEVVSSGLDVDLIYQSRMGLGVQGGVTYTKTEATDFGSALSVMRVDRRDDRLSFAPLWSSSLSLTYKTTFGNYALNSNIGAKYNSSYNTGSNLDPRKLQDAYTLVNGRVGFGAEDSSWTIELWATNLTNEEYAQVMFDAPPGQGSAAPLIPTSTVNGFLGQRRLVGASVILKF